MLEHTTNSEEEWAETYKYVPAPTETEELQQAQLDAIEDYLDRVCAPLITTVDRVKREEIRQTVRTRILQFTDGHRELGSSAQEAVEASLIRCGDPELLSQRWLPQRASVTQVQTTNSINRLKLTDRLFGGAKASTLVASLAFGLPCYAIVSEKSYSLWAAHFDDSVPYYRICLIAVPLLAGLLTGIAAKQKSVRGVVNAVLLCATPALFLPGLLTGFSYSNIILSQSSNVNWLPNPIYGFCGLIPWLVMGSAGAALGNRLRGAAARAKTRLARVVRTRSLGSLSKQGHNSFSQISNVSRTVRYD